MLRKIVKTDALKKTEPKLMSNLTTNKLDDNSNKPLDLFSGKYEAVSIDQPMPILDKKTLETKETQADHGILKILEGTWFSYNEDEGRTSSGIHTTIMPSPGADPSKIPGKFTFDCEEYVEKLHFELVTGAVRNRGGATEQFCGAVKYDQSIKSVSKPKNSNGLYPGIHEENGMYLWMSDVVNNPATEDSIITDRGVHNWNTTKGIEQLIKNLYPSTPSTTELAKFKLLIKEHPYLDVPFFNIGTADFPEYVTEHNIGINKVLSIVPAKELHVRQGIDGPFFIPDYSISRSGVIPHGSTITLLGNVDTRDGNIVLDGKPDFLKMGAITEQVTKILNVTIKVNSENIKELILATSSNKIGELCEILSITIEQTTEYSTIKELIISKLTQILKKEAINSQWDYDHLAVSRTMGGGKNGNNINFPDTSDLKRPFDLDNPPLPFTPIKELNLENDNGENLVYSQRMFLHPLYPFAIRPDLRLRDAINEQTIERYMHFTLSSKNKTGAQGGILNIPFVNRFVPTVEMNMNMWMEEVTENGKTFIQLQYEQIIFFEFGFGDNGGLTSWPHIQVNTLRKYADLNDISKEMADKQFINPEKEALKKKIEAYTNSETGENSKCPYHNA